jgi:hypothetical protein
VLTPPAGQRSIANAVAERLAQGRVAFVFNLDEVRVVKHQSCSR